MEEEKLKQIMKLYTGKFLLSYVHRKSVLTIHGEQREGWPAEHQIPWVHRVTERSSPKCKNAMGEESRAACIVDNLNNLLNNLIIY